MASKEQTLDVFQTRVRQMILRFRQTQKENEDLQAQLDESERECAALRQQLQEKGKEYDALKTARMLAVSDGDIEVSKERLAKLIRDVNKCITVLAEQRAE